MCICQVNVYIAYQLFCNRCHYIICEIIFHELSFIFVNGECICYVPYVCCNCCSVWLQTVTLKSILFPPRSVMVNVPLRRLHRCSSDCVNTSLRRRPQSSSVRSLFFYVFCLLSVDRSVTLIPTTTLCFNRKKQTLFMQRHNKASLNMCTCNSWHHHEKRHFSEQII